MRMPVLLACLTLVAAACTPPITRSNYRVIVHVVSDPHMPLAGAVLRTRGKPLGHSDDTGAIDVVLHGQPGDVVSLELDCPAGYRTPEAQLSVLLRELQERE